MYGYKPPGNRMKMITPLLWRGTEEIWFLEILDGRLLLNGCEDWSVSDIEFPECFSEEDTENITELLAIEGLEEESEAVLKGALALI